ncbi:MAG TPA: enolase C-terminal domain-like protein, partial [Gammaproteobacteria bacterium]
AQDGKQPRIKKIYDQGLLAYNTAGWSGISSEELVERTRKMLKAGWPQIKIKVGVAYSKGRMEAQQHGRILSRKEIDDIALAAAEEDAERMTRVYQTIRQEDTRRPRMKVAIDSNQVFDPRSAFLFAERLARRLYEVNPEFQIDWFEEPTSQHSAAGHVLIQRELNEALKGYAPPLHVPISTGEHGASPVTFKDLLHAPAFDGSGMRYAIDVIQMDYARVGGIGDNLAILLLAKKARMKGRDVRICPHTGGIGLCEGARNIQAIKQALFGSTNNAGVEDILEFVAEETRSVHEGVFENPATVKNGYYQMTRTPGVGVDYTAEGKRQYLLPDGEAWQSTPQLAEQAKKFMLVSNRYKN